MGFMRPKPGGFYSHTLAEGHRSPNTTLNFTPIPLRKMPNNCNTAQRHGNNKSTEGRRIMKASGGPVLKNIVGRSQRRADLSCDQPKDYVWTSSVIGWS